MSGIRNETICAYLRRWIRNSKITQLALAKDLGISQSLLSRQLLCKETIPLHRIEEIIKKTSPPDDEYKKVLDLLAEKKDRSEISLEIHNHIKDIGPDKLLLCVLNLWSCFTIEERKTIAQFLDSVEDRIKKEVCEEEMDDLPDEVACYPFIVSKYLSERDRKRYLTLIHKLAGFPQLTNGSSHPKLKALEKECSDIIKNNGIKNLIIEYFHFIPSGLIPTEIREDVNSTESQKKILKFFDLEKQIAYKKSMEWLDKVFLNQIKKAGFFDLSEKNKKRLLEQYNGIKGMKDIWMNENPNDTGNLLAVIKSMK